MKNRFGFTLIEVLIVVSILAILSVTGFVTLSKQRTKAEDSTMKTDLNRLKTAFEEYYNDNNCYPPAEWFEDASAIQGDELQPYLNQIPLNKKTDQPYVLEKDSSGCSWFKIYTTLNNGDDPQAVLLRTFDPDLGSTLGNYGVSSSNTRVSIFYEGPASPTPTPTAGPNNTYYCSGINNCSSFDPDSYSCTPSYSGPNCDGGANICTSVGSCTEL
jgi:prepilin-type N-terminal cleavage/methylation domain-containing protein